MKVNSFRYYFHEATKSLAKNRLMTIASVSTTFATLFLLGVFMALTINVSSLATQFSRSCEIQVFINDQFNDKYDEIGQKIAKIQYVEKAEKYTKEQIFDEMYKKLGDKAKMLDGLKEDNPFRNSYKIHLSDLSHTKDVTTQLKKIEGIDSITDFQEAANSVVKVVNRIKTISLWLVIILCVIAAFIVSNAIKVSVYSRRKEINIMKYIGATDWFVRWPFIIEGMLIGALGALISFAVVWAAYIKIYASVKIATFQLVPYGKIALVLLVAFTVVGILIGALGSVISIRKHLKV